MKTFLLIFVIAFSSLFAQDAKLKGTYKVEFDQKYGLQGYQITFNDSTYKIVMPDAVAYKGAITYEKFRITLRKDKEENPIEIDNREIGKDMIVFSTKSKTDLSVVVNRGKMVKIK